MKVDTLAPDQYWQTSARDYELAVAVQHAYHEGRQAAADEHRKAEQGRQASADWAGEAIERLRQGAR